MMRKSTGEVNQPIYLAPGDQFKGRGIAVFIIIQCVIILMAAVTILNCFWVPDLVPFDFYKLTSIMYLYDKKACGYSTPVAKKVVQNLQISNNTMGLNVVPFKWTPAIITVSSRLSATTRIYIKISVGIHCCWIALAVAFIMITNHNKSTWLLKVAILSLFCYNIVVLIFDVSMGIFYVSHIKQSLTKGMIVRYSGWSVELNLHSYDAFAGWLPIAASICWMRGIIFLALNIYTLKILHKMRRKLQTTDIMRQFIKGRHNKPIPPANLNSKPRTRVLYYEPGEWTPSAY